MSIKFNLYNEMLLLFDSFLHLFLKVVHRICCLLYIRFSTVLSEA